jgi:hypothetical protein
VATFSSYFRLSGAFLGAGECLVMNDLILKQLRNALRAVAGMDGLEDRRAELPREELGGLAFAVRDASLELSRLHWDELTVQQRTALGDVTHRICATADGQLSPQPLPAKAREALAAFGWSEQ